MSDQGREYLGAAIAAMRNGAQKRRLFQTVAGMSPCRALLRLFKKGKSLSTMPAVWWAVGDCCPCSMPVSGA